MCFKSAFLNHIWVWPLRTAPIFVIKSEAHTHIEKKHIFAPSEVTENETKQSYHIESAFGDLSAVADDCHVSRTPFFMLQCGHTTGRSPINATWHRLPDLSISANTLRRSATGFGIHGIARNLCGSGKSSGRSRFSLPSHIFLTRATRLVVKTRKSGTIFISNSEQFNESDLGIFLKFANS